jgi:hypothetical protein
MIEYTNINMLPTDILLHIYSFLDFFDSTYIKYVCNLWNNITLTYSYRTEFRYEYICNKSLKDLIHNSNTIRVLYISNITDLDTWVSMIFPNIEYISIYNCSIKIPINLFKILLHKNNIKLLLNNCKLYDHNTYELIREVTVYV